MKHPLFLLALSAILAIPVVAADKVASDIQPADQRKLVLERAAALTHSAELAPLPDPLPQPFAPVGFNAANPDEAKATASRAAPTAESVAAKPSTDREFLDLIASKISPSGTLIIGDRSLLIFGKKRLRVGDRLTVTYEGQDYVLDLIAIDRTTFTLRYNSDEITRPIIKTGKSP